ncbi:nitronate monooxygenase [Limnobacter humi]|uniref:Propionate 3-nitronate monooxygenase n=1 Tax=Limnobacter humi TaxID=1778671 RepID=A0ABT1WHF2_9BURK|nr:nitronate monooxygenase [Limnobacter humi]MCQ8896152.1 nitronate monooxygenase [Limnobacter humi]
MTRVYDSFPALIQAPMAGSQGSALAIAVGQSGGLGSLPCAMLGLDQLQAELRLLTEAGLQAYNINFFAHTTPQPNPAQEAAWLNCLKPYFDEWDLNVSQVVSGPGRQPFSAAQAEVLEAYKPAVVSFHFGLPSADLLRRVRALGAQVWSTATTVAEGLWLQKNGADVVIAQGLEAGGHRGHFLSPDLTEQMGTLALLPQLVRMLDIPVIAAGGIATPQAVRAALELGASAVQVGSAYLLANEATTSAVHRAALKSDARFHTALTNLFSGRPARGMVNRVMQELGFIRSEVPEFPLATAAMAPLRVAAERAGLGDFSPLWVGQHLATTTEEPAAVITQRLLSGL